MKKFIFGVLSFLLIFSTLIITIGRFDTSDKCTSDNSNIQKLNCLQSVDSLDILFIGNSYCYSGIIPAYFDSVKLRTYNLGIATAGINFYSLLITDYLKLASKKPKTVFILVSPMIFSNKSDDAMNYPIYRYIHQPISTENYILIQNNGLWKNYPKIAVKSFVKTILNTMSILTTKRKFCRSENNPMFISKGYVLSSEKYSLQTELKTKHLYSSLLKDKFDVKKVWRLAELAYKLESINIKVCFFELPDNKLKKYFNKSYLNDYEHAISLLKSKFIYIPNNLKLNKNSYRDIDHLNSNGAGIASKNMITQIMNNKTLTQLYFRNNHKP